MPNIYVFFRSAILFTFFLLLSQALWATHNRAGEITVEQVGDCTQSLRVKITVVTYSKTSSVQADRDSVDVCFGDGTCQMVVRVNGAGTPPQGEPLENDIKKNIYIVFHTYPSRGTYVISMNDPNRNGGILNVNFPNSEQIRFHIQTVYTFPNPQFQGCNNTPVLLQPPVDVACVGKVFTHNPNAFDRDGDSLSFHFTTPYQDANVVVPNYLFPTLINPGPMNRLTINERTGDIVWDAPQRRGEYNLAIIIVEYRNGVAIDTIVRDMQIRVDECDNKPPVIETSIEEICVIAGEVVDIRVSATAPIDETRQRVRLTALGGPFEVTTNPATFELNDGVFRDDPTVKRFRWQTDCNHISEQYYSVVFKATDNFFGDTSGLATLKTIRIKVVGPPPQEVRAIPGNGRTEVTWKLPYVCEDIKESIFLGFTVWRREGSNVFPLDTCTTGLAGRGYTKLTLTPIKTTKDGRYYFLDETVERGRTYCYRILAEFAKQTPGRRFIYNIVESLPSPEACVQLSRDVPLITNVDVLTTSSTNGQMRVCWSKPDATDLDTIVNRGPYRYEVLRATGMTTMESAFQPIGVNFVSQTFAGANDTCFVDTGLNTAGTAYSYKIRFYTNNSATPLGSTNGASSVFLSVAPTDRANVLSWQEQVPWENYEYHVLLKDAQGNFDTIATVADASYRHTGLVNGQEYCYKIVSVGSYGIPGIISPLYNNSQEDCSIPVDDVPPCPTELEVRNICDEGVTCAEGELFNTLIWTNPVAFCPEATDVVGYNIYFAPTQDAPFQLIASIEGASKTEYEHMPEEGLAGCYYVTSFDLKNNESLPSDTICVDNCPFYSLPNTFTPNGDGQNDLFKPYPFCFIESVEFKVFNRWGQLVFETTDPNINWNGQNKNGQDLNEGTYYYTCRVFERRVEGIRLQTEILSGYIELIRGN
ncbi:MAG: gliding motility-associated C-terminal domain-containing protein [Saprospiraceae bacterium]